MLVDFDTSVIVYGSAIPLHTDSKVSAHRVIQVDYMDSNLRLVHSNNNVLESIELMDGDRFLLDISKPHGIYHKSIASAIVKGVVSNQRLNLIHNAIKTVGDRIRFKITFVKLKIEDDVIYDLT